MKKSSPALSKIDTSKLSNEINELQPPARSLRDVIADLSEAVRRAIQRGVTLEEICTHLKKRGVEIKPDTLKRYLRDGALGKRPPTLSTARAASAAANDLASGTDKK